MGFQAPQSACSKSGSPGAQFDRVLARPFRNDRAALPRTAWYSAGLHAKQARKCLPVFGHKSVPCLKCGFEQRPIHADPQPSPMRENAKRGCNRCGIAAHLSIGIQSLNTQIGMPSVDYCVFFDLFLILIGDHDQLCPSRFCLSNEPIDTCRADSAIGIVKESNGFHSKTRCCAVV